MPQLWGRDWTREELEHNDPWFPVVITVRAVKRAPGAA